MEGIHTFTDHGPYAFGHGGLDLSASMFAPCSLGCPGTPRQHPVSAALYGYGTEDDPEEPGPFNLAEVNRRLAALGEAGE